MIRLSCDATTALGEKIIRAQKLIGPDPSRRGLHRHREPTREQEAALSAAIDTAVAATQLCSSLHPQGCPPQLQQLTSALDEAVSLLYECQRFSYRRFRGEPPQSRNRRSY